MIIYNLFIAFNPRPSLEVFSILFNVESIVSKAMSTSRCITCAKPMGVLLIPMLVILQRMGKYKKTNYTEKNFLVLVFEQSSHLLSIVDTELLQCPLLNIHVIVYAHVVAAAAVVVVVVIVVVVIFP